MYGPRMARGHDTTSCELPSEARAALDCCPMLVTLVGPNGKIGYVNGCAEQVLGLPASEIVGANVADVMAAEGDARVPPPAGTSLRVRTRRRDGESRVIEVRSVDARRIAGIHGTLLFARDVTEGVDAEEALALSETRFRTLAESMNDGIFTVDAEGNTLYANPGLTRITGLTPAELIGESLLRLVHPDDVTRTTAAFGRCLEEGSGQTDAIRVRHKSGAWRVVDGRSARLPPGGDEIAVVNHRDITEQHALREELARNERRFRALTERSGSSVLIVDANGVIRFANSRVSLLGIPHEERLETSMFLRMHPDDVEGARALLREVAAEDACVRRLDLRLRHNDGTWRWHDVTMTNFISDPAVGGVVINNRDITERVLAEDHLRKAHRLEAIGRLAAGVAHDFNNLLLGILGNTSLLASRITDPEQREDLDQIRLAGEHAADLTRQILAFSRRQMLEREYLVVDDLLREIVKLLRRVTRADVEIELLAGAGADTTVYVDRGQLEQVVMNLAVNASDAMPNGGKVVIESSFVELPADPVDDAAAGPHVCIRVSDTGCGMTPDVAAHVFEPFFTTKELGRGTGLGLATVHGVVHQHGGRIDFQTAPGQGSAFRAFLPVSRGAPAPDKGPPERRVSGDELLLVADDDEIARRISVRVLEGAGYRVLTAKSGAEALELFARHDDIALVLLDVVMPNGGGPATLTRMQELRPGVRYLFASGYAFERSEHDERIRGRSLQKPFDLDELLRRVRALIES